MARSIPALVEPSVLRWVRESGNATTSAAARKLAVTEARVRQWEAGEGAPTIAQLRKLAEVYGRPLGVFYLPQPPTVVDTVRDVAAPAGGWSPELHAEHRRAAGLREAALELAEIDGVPPPTAWRLARLPDGGEELAAAARARLLSLAPLPLPTANGSTHDHLNAWSAALEEAGVLVMATSGGRVSTDEVRAFSLHHDELPVIVVNGSDAVRGRLSSLLHEYVHLLLRAGGASDADGRLAARCDTVAAAVLMPRDQVLASGAVRVRSGLPGSWNHHALRDAAAPFGASAEAFARRLLALDRITEETYRARATELRTARRPVAVAAGSHGDWYRTKARDLGRGFVRRVADAHERQVVDSWTAASLLAVKVEQIDRLARAAALRESP